jgi:hypothetical protein
LRIATEAQLNRRRRIAQLLSSYRQPKLREAAMDKKRKSKGGDEDADDHATKKRKMPSVSLEYIFGSDVHIYSCDYAARYLTALDVG